MNEPGVPQAQAHRNSWRIVRWIAALALVLTPAVMMQVSDEWHWTPRGFVLAGIVIGGLMLLYEIAERASGSRAYRAGAAVALAAVRGDRFRALDGIERVGVILSGGNVDLDRLPW